MTNNKKNETVFLCPICSNTIIVEGSQVYCSNDDCMFNPTIFDLLNKLYKRND